MFSKFNQLKKSGFVKDTAWLTAGTAIAQFLPLAISPILTRLYSENDFALFGLYFGFVGFLSVIANLKYEQCILLPKEDAEAKNIAQNSIKISLVVSIIIFIVVLFGRSEIAAALSNNDLKNLLFLVPPAVAFVGIYQVFNFWLIRQKDFKASAYNRIVQKVGESFINLIVALVGLKGGLLMGDIAGRGGVSVFAAYQSVKNKWKSVIALPGIEPLKKYKEFALYGTIPSMLNAATLHIPLFIVSHAYTEQITGQFNLTRMLLASPLSIVSINVGQVLIQRLTQARQKHESSMPLVMKIAGILGIISFAAALFLVLFSTRLFPFLFGAKWEMAGVFTGILAFGFAIRFAISPLTQVFVALEKIKLFSIWQVLYFLSICTLYFFRNEDVQVFLTRYVMIDIGLYSLCFLLIVYLLKRERKRLGNTEN